MRSVAGTEPSPPFATRVPGFLPKRDAAQMGADADDDQPLFLLDPLRVALGIDEVGVVIGFRLRDLLRRTVVDKDRFATPHDRDPLPEFNRFQIDIRRGQRQHVGRRVHGVDERPKRQGRSDRRQRSGGEKKEIPPGLRFGSVPLFIGNAFRGHNISPSVFRSTSCNHPPCALGRATPRRTARRININPITAIGTESH